jgi:hypothetical protein
MSFRGPWSDNAVHTSDCALVTTHEPCTCQPSWTQCQCDTLGPGCQRAVRSGTTLCAQCTAGCTWVDKMLRIDGYLYFHRTDLEWDERSHWPSLTDYAVS